MDKKWLLITILVLFGLTAGFFLLKNRLSPAQAKLEIAETNVSASVYVNGEQVATSTPYEEFRKPGEVTVRLVPTNSDKPLALWETKVNLTEGVTTVIRREFGETDNTSAGEILSFEKIGGKKAELAVVSIPDSAEVKFDSETRGFTPVPIANSTTEEHTLTISHPGYLTRDIGGLKPVQGYKLTIVVFLAEDESTKPKEEEASESAKLQDEPTQTMVEIQDTGTGFLRVREEALKTSPEIARVTPGKKYAFIEEDKTGEWYKIEYEKGKTGWISAEYAQKSPS